MADQSSALSERQSEPVKALPVGARFAYRGEVWRVRENARYVDAEAEQFSNHLTFYDAATARKSGDLCWDIEVERL